MRTVSNDDTLPHCPMANTVNLFPRDMALLKLLSRTPATTSLLFKANGTLRPDPFLDERRLRERLQTLSGAGFIRSWPAAFGSGGLRKYFKVTPTGFQRLYGADVTLPTRSFFAEVSPSLFEHTFRLAEAIVTVVKACHDSHASVERFIRENDLSFPVGNEQVLPDCFFRLKYCGRFFNLAFEIDQSTESLDSFAANSVREKLSLYHRYQDQVLKTWQHHGKQWERPRLRVVFFTKTIERAYHILALAAEASANPSRKLVYAAPLETFTTDPHPLQTPLFLDHSGQWQALVDLHPTAPFTKTRVRLQPAVENPYVVC